MSRPVSMVAAGLSLAAVAPVASAVPAAASCDGGISFHEVNTWRGDHLLNGRGTATNVAGGRERWCDFRTSETPTSPWGGFDVCDYQGAIYVYNPDSTYADRNHVSSYHSGCSFQGWFFHDPIDDTYVEDKRFATKWRSDRTQQEWKAIGTLTD